MQPRRLLEALLGFHVALLVVPAVGLAGLWSVAADGRLAAMGAALLDGLDRYLPRLGAQA